MKRFLCFLGMFVFSACSTTKVFVDYKNNISDNSLIKEYKLSVTKKEKNYVFDTVLYIKGQIVDLNKNPITNKEFLLDIEGVTPNYDNILVSDDKGFFEKKICYQYKYINKYYSEPPTNTIVLNFSNNNSLYDINQEFQLGNDIILTNPYKILYEYPFNNKTENIIYLKDKKLEKEIKLTPITDIIILSTNNFSAQYYRDKIQKETKEEIIKRKRLTKIVKSPDNCNLTYKNEDEIFEATGFPTDIKKAIDSLMGVSDERWISVRVQIRQIFEEKKILFHFGRRILSARFGNGMFPFYGVLKNSCRKDIFSNGQWVDIAAIVKGTTYITVNNETIEVPKVFVYAIRPSIFTQEDILHQIWGSNKNIHL